MTYGREFYDGLKMPGGEGWKEVGKAGNDEGLVAMQLVRDKEVLYGEGGDGILPEEEEE